MAAQARSGVSTCLARAILLGATLGMAGCSPQALLVRSAADQLAGQGTAAEEDIGLAREASAFYLKLSESVLARSPGHLPLAEAVAGGFTQYAYAFVGFDAERLETTDAKQAMRLRERAARLYRRAHGHAMAAIEQQRPGFRASLADPTFELAPLAAEQVGLAYWAAAAWGGYIALSKDQPDIVADLPQAVRLARMAWERNPVHGDGALASLMGSFEAARPGGSARQAALYFDQAIAASAGRSAGPFVAKAESLALPAADRREFESLLRKALAISAQRPDLPNEVMRERALWLLDTADDRF